MLKSILCHYSDASLLASGSITVVGAGADNVARSANRYNKQAIFKNWARFTDCMTEINNMQVDNGKDLDVAMPMHNLIEFSDNY